MKKFLLVAIRFYQKYLSPDRACRFIPSCSEYSYQAIEKYGIIQGLWLSFCRIVRCHPFSKGGIDEIP
ncbi:membrane protein insertion efficiency factor YidD [Candidatus Gottesmanbacteria bacterium]|nr:membrane protein insertion efficiency factor YidD [Candidatus Gottesmanbacteria bacterium]MBI5465262.1 membrane protein insertion efficiency factor YidD [Candidatus Gottesmanbacteria bacterium]